MNIYKVFGNICECECKLQQTDNKHRVKERLWDIVRWVFCMSAIIEECLPPYPSQPRRPVTW